MAETIKHIHYIRTELKICTNKISHVLNNFITVSGLELYCPYLHIMSIFCLQQKPKQCLFPVYFRRYVCSLLDVEDRIHQKDWTQVAEKGLGLSLTEIRWIRDLKESAGRSPTEKLLDQWTEQGKTLEEFETLMKEMGLRNVVVKLRELKLNTSS